MKKNASIAITVVYCFLAGFLRSQDYHLAQYDAAMLYMNPASTGMYEGAKGDYRICSDFRSQWSAIGVKPFTTAFVSYDMPLQKWNRKWGVGGFIVSNKAGFSNFQTLTLMGSGAYDIMNGTDEHYLTTGLQMGLFYRSFNPNAYTYDIQYSQATGDFDTNIPNGENFGGKINMVRFDANLGIRYRYKPQGKKYSPFGGFSMYHLTIPNESITGKASRLPMRMNLNVGSDFYLNENFTLQPRALYMYQRKANELNMGLLAFYKIKNSSLDILGGADYRNKDALIFHLGFRQGQSVFRFSYDLNTSSLNTYSSGKGAWEFSLILTGQRDKPLFQPLF
jgi:type IX secretion system PorP/SprF family membrane protein